jgi:hypothetical protein
MTAMGPMRKLALGPVRQISCRACGQAVGVGVVHALISFIPCATVIILVITKQLRGVDALIGAGLISLIFTCLLYVWWVPLVKRGLTNCQLVEAARTQAVDHY